MCTIGGSFYNIDGVGLQSVFKQCDLISKTEFIAPKVETSDKSIRYVPFTRDRGGEYPAWAGINEYGVSFVAADSYIDADKKDKCTHREKVNASVFDMYKNIIASYTTADEAVKMAKEFYENSIYASDTDPLTDILLIADRENMYFIETVNKVVRIVHRKNGYFASTNHCRMFFEAVPYEQNHSTYLRLDRAEKILQNKPDIDGIGDLLRDSYYGKTVWSVCRYASLTDKNGSDTASNDTEEDLFYTQAAVIFTVLENSINPAKPEIICEYVINNNAAAENVGRIWKPFEEEASSEVKYIGKSENIKQYLNQSDLIMK